MLRKSLKAFPVNSGIGMGSTFFSKYYS